MDYKITSNDNGIAEVTVSGVTLETAKEIYEACSRLVSSVGFNRYRARIIYASKYDVAEAVKKLGTGLSLTSLPRYKLQKFAQIFQTLQHQPRPVLIPDLPMSMLLHKHHAYVLVGAHSYIQGLNISFSYDDLDRLSTSDLRKLCIHIHKQLFG